MVTPYRRIRGALVAALAAAALVAGVVTALPGHAAGEPFRDPALPLHTRIDDLVGRLSTDEKISLLHQYSPAIPRLEIAAFRTGTEALHGVAWLGPATVFPQAIGLATTWDPALIGQVGNAVGREARGFHSRNRAANGLNLWAPVVNPLRDPRWGRNEEGYSEDPYLTARTAIAYGRGITGEHPTYLQAAPTLKHYLAYNNETNRTTTSSVAPPRILSDFEQAAFRPVIEAGAATGVMTSYNLVNGRPATVNPDLDSVVRGWTDDDLLIVGDAAGAANLVGAQRYHPDQPTANAAAIRAGLDSFTENDSNSGPTTTAIRTALQRGLLTEADIDSAAGHVLAIRFRLGEFDPAGAANPYAAITAAVIDSPEHRQLARRAAAQQVVLLRNEAQALPLAAGATDRVAVVGPLADTLYTDWYSGTMPYKITPAQGVRERLGSTGTVATSEGVDRVALRVASTGRYVSAPTAAGGGTLTGAGTAPGPGFDVFDWGEETVTLRAAANGRYLSVSGGALVNNAEQPNGWYVQQQFSLVRQADGTDVIEYVGKDATESWFGANRFVVVGSDGRLTLGSPTATGATRFTREVLTSGVEAAVAAATGADAAVVVVGSTPMINGREADDRRTIALPAAQQELIRAVRAVNPRTIVVLETSYPVSFAAGSVPAALWTSHAGQETGHAVADVLFGDVDPSGRLTQTWYASDADLPAMLDYDVARSGHTYQYFRGVPLYPFGHGLSYTTFGYANLRLSSASVPSTGRVTVSVDVTNTGARAGVEVVQLYSRATQSRASQPLRSLRAFERVSLAGGETRTVQLDLPAAELAFWDVTRGRRVVETGAYDLLVGRSAGTADLATTLSVQGETIPDRALGPAVSFDDYSGVTLVDTTKAAGTAVSATAGGQWIAFRSVAVGTATGISARVSRPGSAAANIEVRLGSPTGTRVASLPVPATADRYTWSTATTALSGATGRQDLYLVFTGPALLDTIELTGS